jgi:hypothetical protein
MFRAEFAETAIDIETGQFKKVAVEVQIPSVPLAAPR